MNSTCFHQPKKSEASKFENKKEDFRPQTTQWYDKTKKKIKMRPSSDICNPNKTDSFGYKFSIFDQKVSSPPYENLAFSESPWNTNFKNSSMFAKKSRVKKPISSEKSYKALKNKMIEKLKIEQKNHNFLNEGCKTFYWSPDLSFCAFATDKQIQETSQLWSKNKRIDAGQRIEYIVQNNNARKKISQNMSFAYRIGDKKLYED